MVRRIILGVLLSTGAKATEFCDVCPIPNIIDVDGGPIDPRDKAAFTRALQTCAEEYGPENPCVSQFVRFEPGHYSVICGPTVKEICKEK